MSEVLARIRVRETHGIRRFLYPLQTTILMPNGAAESNIGMVDDDGRPIPFELSLIFSRNAVWGPEQTWDFAVSLEPFSEREYMLAVNAPQITVDDPLQVTFPADNAPEIAAYSVQNKFSVALDWYGFISTVNYDDIPHLRAAMEISRNGDVIEPSNTRVGPPFDKLRGTIKATGVYDSDLCDFETRSDITACKSWATITHILDHPKPNDEIVFTLPLAITSPTLTCDFGVGGYVFGKMDNKASEIVWRTEFGNGPFAKWTVATAGRVDYVGEVETADAFLPQRWFHLIDSDKALAVAITKVPSGCREMTVRLTLEGDVTITFRLGETVTGPAEFGVCYHFLNDVPAIAAATNPQSILLPPVVEVLAL